MISRYLIYGNLFLYFLFILITLYYINYVYGLDSNNKYATYMENECDGKVIEQYTMRYISCKYIDTDSIRSQQKFIKIFSILLLIAYIVFIILLISFRIILDSEIVTTLLLLNGLISFYLLGNILFIRNENNTMYSQLISYKKTFTDVQTILGNSIFTINVLDDLQLNDYTPVNTYLKTLLKRKSLYENLNSINDAIIDYNESIKKHNYEDLIKYIDFKNDRDALILAYIDTCDNNIFRLNQFNKESDLNSADSNVQAYMAVFIEKLAKDPYLNIQNRDMDYKLQVFNNFIENENYTYLFDKLKESIEYDPEMRLLSALNYANLQVFYKLADYNYGNILYNSTVDTYYTGNNDYVLINSKYEVHVLNMKFYLLFLMAFIGFLLIRLLIFKGTLNVRSLILLFLIVFGILLFIASILRVF